MSETKNCVRYFIFVLALYSPLFLFTKDNPNDKCLKILGNEKQTVVVTSTIQTNNLSFTTTKPFLSTSSLNESTENTQVSTTTVLDTAPLTSTATITTTTLLSSTAPVTDLTYATTTTCTVSEQVYSELYTSVTESNKYYNLSAFEISILEKLVSCEYGADWVSVEEKSKIVAGVMNRVKNKRFPNTIYDVIVQQGQFTGFDPYGEYYISDSIRESVKYYFEHENEYEVFNSWWGDGYTNHFYYQ